MLLSQAWCTLHSIKAQRAACLGQLNWDAVVSVWAKNDNRQNSPTLPLVESLLKLRRLQGLWIFWLVPLKNNTWQLHVGFFLFCRLIFAPVLTKKWKRCGQNEQESSYTHLLHAMEISDPWQRALYHRHLKSYGPSQKKALEMCQFRDDVVTFQVCMIKCSNLENSIPNTWDDDV